MNEKMRRDLRFVLNALGFALMLMAVMFTIKPYLEGPDPQQPDIDAYRERVLQLRAEEIPVLLRSPDRRPTMLLVYASWCGACRTSMPDIMRSLQWPEAQGMRTVFLSIDRNPFSLSKYIVHENYQSEIMPYMMQSGEIGRLPEFLSKTGSGYSGYIPYIGFFDADARLVHELAGGIDRRLLKQGFAAASRANSY